MKSKSLSRVTGILSAVLVVALVAALPAGTAAKKKKKKVCPPGTVKQVVKKKKGKKKKRCVPITAVTPTPAPTAAPAALAISPTSSDFGTVQHGISCPLSTDCAIRSFTVTNTGGSPSGTPVPSITVVTDPAGGGNPPAFKIKTNDGSSPTTCTGALAPGGSCSITVQFAPDDNPGGPNQYVSRLDVTGSPGGTAQATLTGNPS